MKTRAIIIGLAALGGAAWVASCATQPPLPCIVARASSGAFFASLYTPTKTLSAADMGSACYFTGEQVAFEKFNPTTDPDPTKGVQDYKKATLAIEASTLPGLQAGSMSADTNTAHVPYSLGDYPQNPDSKGFCTSATMSPAEQDIPAGALGAGSPELDYVYTWSNVGVTSETLAPGTQYQGSLTIAEKISGCSIDYTVWGVWPAAGCQATDSSGNPLTDDAGNPALDQTLCNPTVSGVSKNFPTVCTNIGQPGAFAPLCVLQYAPPAIYNFVDGGWTTPIK